MTIKTLYRRRTLRALAVAAIALNLNGFSGFSASAIAQEMPAPEPASVSYARMADLVSTSPAVARIQVRSVKALETKNTPSIAPGRARFFVDAETLGLIRSEGVLAKRISFLVDGSAANARRPGLKKQLFLIFGKTGTQVNQFQLTSSTAFIPWSPANEALARKVIADVMTPNAPPAVTDINAAFHVPGAILGEGETQIFVETADSSTISLSVIRRPQEQPHFAVSLGEVVDEAARLPEKDTMLWYRLACGLPAQLPALSLTELDRVDAEAANRDYNAFREALGECDRTATYVL